MFKLTAVLLMGVVFLSGNDVMAAGKLTVSSPQDPGSLDPVDTFLVNWASIGTNVFDGLTWRGPDMKIEPGLSTSWEELDNGMRIRFRLRQGVTFHNGEPFNATAVKFTFDRLLGQEGGKGPQQSNYISIKSVAIVDDYTVDFILKEHDPVLLTKLAGYGAMIVPPKYIAEKGEEYFNMHPIGTGAFQVVDYQPRIKVALQANEHYWRGAPKLSELEYRFISEPATAVAELQAGRVDLVIPPTIPVGMIDTIRKSNNLDVVTAQSPTVVSLRFNTRDGITKDLRVRKALNLAIDREAIIQSILMGQAEAISSFQSSLSFGNDPAMKPVAYDPEQARALLKEAGVKDGAEIQIDIRGNDATFGEVAQAIASYLQVVGINATVKTYETNVLLNDIIPNGKTGAMFQQSWGGWTFDFDNTAIALYHTGEKWNPYERNEELDKMLLAQRSILNRSEREKALQDIAHYTVDHAYEMNLYSTRAIYGINKRVKNFVPAPDSRMLLNTVEVQ